MKTSPERILVVRNDKLGDFMLAWPAFSVIRKLFPNARIYALVPEYTRPVAELCPWLDDIIVAPATTGVSASLALARQLRPHRLDAAICFYSRPETAVALLLAGIGQRFAPASRIVQFFYNHRLKQRRSRSIKPEYQYNIDLANFMGSNYGLPAERPAAPPYLKVDQAARASLRQNLVSQQRLEQDAKIIFIHCGSGGSAINLSIEQYAQLIQKLAENTNLFFVLSAGPGEYEQTKSLSDSIPQCPHIIFHSQDGLPAFINRLSIADILICGSTGVLHLAGALDVPTAAFYPSRRSATALRWQTLNSDGRRLAFSANDENMAGIDLDRAALEISQTLI
jgi:ADP-heptose:LPS heptosyltransferase